MLVRVVMLALSGNMRRYKCTIHDGINAGLDTAGIADGATGVARQTGPALEHASPALA